ncbi:MAG: hypothetical protein HYV16_11885 [Gammaproteobacteria bacterium]|nr:hypothetical protein [Gammaproteobacteria bacterium]
MRLSLSWSWLLALTASSAHATLRVDGRLDEAEWRSASVLPPMVTVSPWTSAEPEYRTEVRYLARPDGLYLGFRNEQPPETRLNRAHIRDAFSESDFNEVAVDFDGRGVIAYDFFVSSSNSVRDGVWFNEREINGDWDGSWEHATHADDRAWYSEIRIPWEVAPMVRTEDGQRRIGLYVSRWVMGRYQRYAFPNIRPLQRFISVFAPVTVPDFDQPVFHATPYATVIHDNLRGEAEADAGVDLFWRPRSDQQLTATVNPDFGQVESDELVVNFSAVETLRSDKRPFFTENQGLFDLRGTEDLRLVHTRRIGAAPDRGLEGASELLGAAKYMGVGEQFDYGVFLAAEEDGQEARGRDYAVTRLRWHDNGHALGLLATRARRPSLEREARVEALDLGLSLAPELRLESMLMSSEAAERDRGGWLRLRYAPQRTWNNSLELTRYGRDFDVNDLGYQRRPDLSKLRFESMLDVNGFAPESPSSNRSLSAVLELAENTAGLRLPGLAALGWREDFRSSASLGLYWRRETSGTDDRLTRGHGELALAARDSVELIYRSTQSGSWRYAAGMRRFQEGLGGWARELSFGPSYTYSPELGLGLRLAWLNSADWLIWRAGERVDQYERELVTATANLVAQWQDRHELRASFQWLGLRAEAFQGWRVADRRLAPLDEAGQDFSFADLAFQIRYRYAMSPVTDLFLVYGRGGQWQDGEHQAYARLFETSLSEPEADSLLVKWRHRF